MMHHNAHQIETLYAAIAQGDADAAAACYADAADTYFEDIAFRCRSRKEIHEMWGMVCHAKPMVTFGSAIADDERGNGHWTADYMFGKTDSPPGRRVVNTTTSVFTFRGGLIVTHRDRCDPKAWARQAYPFPKSFFVGSIGPLRRLGAAGKLREFLKAHP
jgi:ketosteroid isomerase-like protein